jgi:hypothetical protein
MRNLIKRFLQPLFERGMESVMDNITFEEVKHKNLSSDSDLGLRETKFRDCQIFFATFNPKWGQKLAYLQTFCEFLLRWLSN